MSKTYKKKIITISLIVTVVLILMKVTAAYLTNSIGVYSEVLNNGLDFVSVLITFLAIRMAVKPADKDHTYGHGKYENLSALIEVGIITILGFYIIIESIKRIVKAQTIGPVQWYIYLILSAAVLINIIRVIYIGKAAKKYSSIALRSNFINYTGDIFSSIIVIGGLVLSNYGIHIADPIASIIVSLIVLTFGFRLGISTVRNLLDYIPGDITEKISRLVISVPEVKSIEELKIHEVGNIKFINILITLPDNMMLTQIQDIKDRIRKRIKKDFYESSVLIEARLLDKDKSLEEKIRERFLQIEKIKDIHNVKIYRIGSSIDISIHIEFYEQTNLIESEKLTHKAEDMLKESIPNIRSIFVHVEEQKKQEEWSDITDRSEDLISKVKKLISKYIDPGSCHYFTVLEKDGNYNIAFHCRLDKGLNIKEAHNIITKTEDKIKKNFNSISDVSIHVEPY